MEFVVRSKNVKLTEALRAYAEKKLGKLQRYWEGIRAAQVLLEVERGQHICEVTVPLAGAVLRAEARTEDMYQAIDEVVGKLQRQIQKYKSRFDKGVKSEAAGGAEAGEPEADPIVRQKRFPIKPMHPDEAVMQMNLVGHDFFVFMNAETECTNVVYRRRDGRYGLLEPDV